MNTVVCGPPGSGKSTFVKKHARWGDLIIDLDEIYHAISGLPYYEKPEVLLKIVLLVRDTLVCELARNPSMSPSAWIITSGSKKSQRETLRRDLNAKVIVMETPYFECWRRIANDDRRKAKTQLWEPLIKKWWDTYEPSGTDTIIRE